MNKQRKVLITTTYNEMGIIIDTKAEEVAQPNLQPTCNQLATDCISRRAAIEAMWHSLGSDGGELQSYAEAVISDAVDEIKALPPAQPGCEDAVPRTSVEYICRKNTVSTNPYEHKYHDKFIQFMDDPEISDFGRWQHSNGFNTALVAVKCDLDKVPSVTPKQPGRIPVTKPQKGEENG